MNHSTRPRHIFAAACLLLLTAWTGVQPHFAGAQTIAGNASFSSAGDQNLLTYDFGTYLAGPNLSFDFSVFNLPSGSGSTAPLTLAGVSSIGSTAGIELQHLPIAGLAGGSSAPLSLVLKRNVFGDFAVNYLLEFSSDGLPSEPAQLITVSGFGRVVLGGDVDVDNDVDGADFLIWQRGMGLGPSATLEQGDANLNGFVTADDLALWKANFGTTAPMVNSVVSAQVPEPQAAILLLVAAGVFAGCRTRRFRSLSATMPQG